MLAIALAVCSFAYLTLGVVFPHRNNETALQEPLRFTENGSFHISIFEDTHLGENAWDDWGPLQDVNTTTVMSRILDIESPQLVVFNGDIITGDNAYLENSTHYMDQVVAPLLARNLSWASTYGNHDSQYNLSGADLLARERQWPNARTSQMVFRKGVGTTNYYLPVYPNSCTSGIESSCTPELLLWFFDARGGFEFQQRNESGGFVARPNWVDSTVVDWFKDTSSILAYNNNKTIPSLAFVHHPIKATRDLQEEGIDPNRYPGINDDWPIHGQADGYCKDGSEGCFYGGQDEPFMSALASTAGLMAVFSAHDHGISWCGTRWNSQSRGRSIESSGVNLCFGPHTGYGGYGTWARGSRQVLITEPMLQHAEVETWIRLERGEIIGQVSLNSTYGKDLYPAVPNPHSTGPNDEYVDDE
ncbi:hypothetical protein Q7P37_002521 [Cladosporium fusiforme]